MRREDVLPVAQAVRHVGADVEAERRECQLVRPGPHPGSDRLDGDGLALADVGDTAVVGQ
ncbi:hypothetical protein [Marinitenerispora sediminis]|uniref:hypothetical protein n=1 Tax=Marinitenerispora sediminis TaxID=1931232 RepID=UPI0013146C77|nr:hypothetical protein [Marinitenerispora sediminis]